MLSKRMSLTSTISSYFWVNVFCRSVARVLAQPGEHLGVHAGDAVRRLAQALAVGVLADGERISRTAAAMRGRSTGGNIALPLVSGTNLSSLGTCCFFMMQAGELGFEPTELMLA